MIRWWLLVMFVLSIGMAVTACSSEESAFCRSAKDVLTNGLDGAELVDALRDVATDGLDSAEADEWAEAVDRVEASVVSDNSWDMRPAGDFVSGVCAGEVTFSGPAHP